MNTENCMVSKYQHPTNQDPNILTLSNEDIRKLKGDFNFKKEIEYLHHDPRNVVVNPSTKKSQDFKVRGLISILTGIEPENRQTLPSPIHIYNVISESHSGSSHSSRDNGSGYISAD